MDEPDNYYLLPFAVLHGNHVYLEECVQNGEDFFQRYLDGETLLHHSITSCKVEIVIFLLHYGMNPNVANDLGNTPLHHAVLSRRLDMVEALLQYGADPDLVNENGRTP